MPKQSIREFESLKKSSQERLLGSIDGSGCVYFFRTYGNIGDRLIHAGARQLLRDVSYREVDIRDAPNRKGRVAIICGSGGWCKPWHDMPLLVARMERNFKKVIVFPSSFELAEPTVAFWLRKTKAKIFAREPASLESISDFRSAELALDTAFWFDFRPYLMKGSGILRAFRTDREKRTIGLPRGNQDISVTAVDLDNWLHTIARCSEVHTDRAHVMIAAAMLGKSVLFAESSYHKLCSLADYALKDFRVNHCEPSVISRSFAR